MTSGNGTYPYHRNFQSKVLAVAVQHPTFLSEFYDTLQPSYFDDEYAQYVVEIILSYYERYKVRPTRSVLLTEAEAYIERYSMLEEEQPQFIQEVNRAFTQSIEDADYVRDHVIEFAQWQHVQTAVMEIAEVIGQERGHGSVRPDLVDKLQKALFVGTGQDLGVQAFDHALAIPDYLAADPLFSVERKVRTGIVPLDNALKGGPGAGELYCVAGESGVGKSMFLINLAVAAVKKGKRVVYYTLELKPPDVLLRFFAALARVSIDYVQTGHPLYLERVEEWRKFGSQYFRVQFYAPGTATVAVLRAHLARLCIQERTKPDLLIVDYADELRSAKDYGDNTYLGYGDVYSELINMGSEYRCPLWTASQLNRAGYGQIRPGRETLADSNKKMYKADGVLFLCQDNDENAASLARLWVDKLRRGPDKFEVPLRFYKALCKLRTLTQAEQSRFKDMLQ